MLKLLLISLFMQLPPVNTEDIDSNYYKTHPMEKHQFVEQRDGRLHHYRIYIDKKAVCFIAFTVTWEAKAACLAR